MRKSSFIPVTAKILTHPHFDRPVVAQPKRARVNSRGCINFVAYRARRNFERFIQGKQSSLLESGARTRTAQDELDRLSGFVEVSIKMMEDRLADTAARIKSMSTTHAGAK